MSVQCNQYMCYGYLVDFKKAREILVGIHGEDGYTDLSDKYSDSAFNDDVTRVHGCSMIEDGMNGGYTFFGMIYDKSNNGDMLATQTMPTVSQRDKIITEHEFSRVFNELFNNADPKFILLTHYR